MSHYIKKPKITVLMLKGEKGEQGSTTGATWGTITGNIASQTDLINQITQSVKWGDVLGDITEQEDLTTRIQNVATSTIDATPITNAEIDAICV